MAMEENLPNQEIIDATQDAVLNAVGSVVNAIETTAHGLGAHEAEPFYQSAEFWVAVSFVATVLALMRPVIRIGYKMLRKRRNLIAKRIEDASNVHAEAQKMLADYERKYRQAKNEAAEILNRAEREIAILKKDRLTRLENDMANKEREAVSRIAAAQDEAVREVTEKTAELTIRTVREVLARKLTPAGQDKLIDESISLLAKIK